MSTPSPELIIGRLHVIPIPLNDAGFGPEMREAYVVRTEYHLWDETNRLIAVGDRPAMLQQLCNAWNERYDTNLERP